MVQRLETTSGRTAALGAIPELTKTVTGGCQSPKAATAHRHCRFDLQNKKAAPAHFENITPRYSRIPDKSGAVTVAKNPLFRQQYEIMEVMIFHLRCCQHYLFVIIDRGSFAANRGAAWGRVGACLTAQRKDA